MDEAHNTAINANDQASINQNISNYTIEGVIHFLQLELIKVESQRSKWELEKTELQAQLAFLQGERQGQEKLKKDLVRRIKMLEYALKQERTRNQFLQNETNPNDLLPLQKISLNKPAEMQVLSPVQKLDSENSKTQEYNIKWRSSRERLLQILNEVKCTDVYLNKCQPKLKQLFMNSLGSDLEESALRTLDNLDNELDKNSELIKNFNQITSSSGKIGNKAAKNGELNELIELLAVGVNELNKNRTENGDKKLSNNQEINSLPDKGTSNNGIINNYELGDLNRISVADNLEAEDGERLNDNENDHVVSDASNNEQNTSLYLKKQQNLESQRKKQLKFVCKGHYDCVRTVKFLNEGFSLISGSDDGTIILWDLSNDTSQTKGFMSEFLHNDTDKEIIENEVEPSFIFRGHKGPVLRLSIVPNQKENENPILFLSSGFDGVVRSWRYPKTSEGDESDTVQETKEMGPIYSDGCEDPIWAMDVHSSNKLFVTVNATGKVNFWNLEHDNCHNIQNPKTSIQISDICSKNGFDSIGRPSSVIFIPDYYFTKTSNCSESIFALISTTKGYLIIVNADHAEFLCLLSPFSSSKEERNSFKAPEYWLPTGIHCMAFQSPIAITNLALGHEDGYLRLIDLSKVVEQLNMNSLGEFRNLGSLQDYSNGQISRFDPGNAITDIDINSGGLNLVYCDDKNWFKLVNFNKVIVKSNEELSGSKINLSVALHKSKPFVATGLSNCVINIYNHDIVSS